jgi:hypothetical protein
LKETKKLFYKNGIK